MIINPTKSMAVYFTKARVTESLNCYEAVTPEASICRYLAINLRWVDQANYTVKNAWKSFQFTM
jgi:hypothetical protein